MRKWLAAFLASTYGNRLDEVERQVGRLRLDLQGAIEDAAMLHDKTYRLHQSLVKRNALADRAESRKVAPESKNDRPGVDPNERILERRRRHRGLSEGIQQRESGSGPGDDEG